MFGLLSNHQCVLLLSALIYSFGDLARWAARVEIDDYRVSQLVIFLSHKYFSFFSPVFFISGLFSSSEIVCVCGEANRDFALFL